MVDQQNDPFIMSLNHHALGLSYGSSKSDDCEVCEDFQSPCLW